MLTGSIHWLEFKSYWLKPGFQFSFRQAKHPLQLTAVIHIYPPTHTHKSLPSLSDLLWPCQVQLYIATLGTFIDWRDMNMPKRKRKLYWWKTQGCITFTPCAVNSATWGKVFSSTHSLILRRLCPWDVPLPVLPSRPLLYVRAGDGWVTAELTVLLAVAGLVNEDFSHL